ncbi:anti-phage defense-associated sirtuin Dsr1 [Tistrella sp. BH-R2-4]|uniref:Anti-phage defense-associated sirtuin Dsr1 n=1 Tax=Tistrella arctica TaxID=3133430 RepID=A0ABU9YGZ6_9PROT
MQFIKNGPDVPDRLIRAHEEGRVVFFCGAGISYPARLPGFAGLVEKLYEELSVTPNPTQTTAIEAKQYDIAINLLEADHSGGRAEVRQAMVRVLQPDLDAPGALITHKALLTLGRTRDGEMRLITTNFDRLFEEVIQRDRLDVSRSQAPFVPIPKHRWDGLIYLHGLLSDDPKSAELDQLVISSGDFGLAYLVERWAARFISEVLRKHIVCFVGYSINDPVLRYMMDALAADRLLGESTPEMFAFGDVAQGMRDHADTTWRAKGVTPILYCDRNNHAFLHETLHAWAEIYRDGVAGKERIVAENAMKRPAESTVEDNFGGRLLWALSDPSGVPAKRFADAQPVPSLDWLDVFEEKRYGRDDLPAFGVHTGPPDKKKGREEDVSFSLLQRPAPFTLAPLMTLTGVGSQVVRWDKVMCQLSRWLLRHLGDPRLLLRVANSGIAPHEALIWFIGRRLDEISRKERDGDLAALERLGEGAPMAVPGPAMRKLWRLLLAGRVRRRGAYTNIDDWQSRLGRDGLTAAARSDLRAMLTPYVSLSEAAPYWTDESEEQHPTTIRDLVSWEIILATEHAHTRLRKLSDDPHWTDALPDLLDDFSMLLRDTLDLMRDLDRADDRRDLSYHNQPSIAEHPQNQRFQDWTALIDLTRDAWLATADPAPDLARIMAERWWRIRYPLFKRLALFAAAERSVIPRDQALNWLLADDRHWLWDIHTQLEAVRLIAALAPVLDSALLARLEEAILDGPPHDEATTAARDEFADRNIWRRLIRIDQNGGALSALGKARLAELSAQYPEWPSVPDEQDGFSSWMTSGWVGERDPRKTFQDTPSARRAFVSYILAQPDLPETQQDDWPQRCRDDYRLTAYALCHLARHDIWPTRRWQEALRVWREEAFAARSWRHILPLLASAPDDLLKAAAYGISSWAKVAAERSDGQDHALVTLADRMLDLDHVQADETDGPLSQAINHPVGHMTEALLLHWFRQRPEDRQGIPEQIAPLFTKLCDTTITQFRHGRVLLATRLITLFRVDPEWTTRHLLPLFDWQRSDAEARAAWYGFLWSPQLYRPLMEQLKSAFLDTARHYPALGGIGRKYATLLTFAALDPRDVFTIRELADATAALPPEGLVEAAGALIKALDASGAQRGDYWANRVVPYLRRIWPHSRERLTPPIQKRFARLCITAGDGFPDAVEALHARLTAVDDPDSLLHDLAETDLCGRFPEPALRFLDVIIGTQPDSWATNDLRTCLVKIAGTMLTAEADQRYRRLMTYVRLRSRA